MARSPATIPVPSLNHYVTNRCRDLLALSVARRRAGKRAEAAWLLAAVGRLRRSVITPEWVSRYVISRDAARELFGFDHEQPEKS